MLYEDHTWKTNMKTDENTKRQEKKERANILLTTASQCNYTIRQKSRRADVVSNFVAKHKTFPTDFTQIFY